MVHRLPPIGVESSLLDQIPVPDLPRPGAMIASTVLLVERLALRKDSDTHPLVALFGRDE